MIIFYKPRGGFLFSGVSYIVLTSVVLFYATIYFNVFGKRGDPDGTYAAVIRKWTASMIKGKEVFINGDGESSRDFCFIENTVQMNILAAIAPKEAKDEVCNVAVGGRTILNDLYRIIKYSLNANGVKTKVNPIYRDFSGGDVLHSQSNIVKAVSGLGYVPEWSVLERLNETITWSVESS